MSTTHKLLRPRWARWSRWLGGLVIAASLVLTGCVTGYPGSGDVPGDDYPGNGYGNQRLLGTVQDVDLNTGRLRLTTHSRYGSASQVELTFGRNTPLVYQGRVQSVEGLERGDRVSVDTEESQGRLWARRIDVVENVRDTPGGGYYGGELRGAVSTIDPRSHMITLTSGGYSGSREQVYYDERTQVEYRGQRFRPEQLDPGDVVRIQARPWGNGWMAERIWVEVDARSR